MQKLSSHFLTTVMLPCDMFPRILIMMKQIQAKIYWL